MPEMPSTNSLLIQRIKDPHDQRAWHEFVQLYEPIILRLAQRRGLQPADSVDVAQQVFLSVARAIVRWEAGDDRRPFRAWLSTVARNAITKELTRRPRDRAAGSTSSLNALHSAAARQATDSELRNESRREIVLQACDRIRHEFSAATWTAFWKTTIEGDSIADVAALTGKSTGSIYVARHRIIERLRSAVAEASQAWEIDSP